MRHFLPALLILTLSLWHGVTVATAANYQQCLPSETCTIGEFLYDDDYSELPGQSCTLTAKYPDGTPFVSAQAMSDRGDGWYSYDVSVGTTEGLYSATICCTPSSGLMCLDKSFEVKSVSAGGATAEEIWTYGNRTLSSYGTLVSDIWNYSTRSLTSFGNLTSEIWGYSSRTMTSFSDLVSSIWGAKPAELTAQAPNPSGLDALLAEQKTQRELLEKLVNAPIVTLELEDNDAPDLSYKLETSKKDASLLYDNIQSTKSKLISLDSKWSRLSSESITQELTSITTTWTDPAPLLSLSKAWNTPIITTLNQESSEVKNSLNSLLTSVALKKSQTAPPSLLTTITALDELESSLGDVTSSSGDSTLFGYLESVAERNLVLQNESQKLTSVLEDWDSQGETVLSNRIKDSQSRLLAINEYPGASEIIKPSMPGSTGKSALKNLVFSLQGLIGLNQNLLASNVDAPVRGLWLEEGSIIFRAVITNPSTIIAQSAPLKFYLPKELVNDDILTIDPSLTANYDTIEETLVVTGTYDLNPGTTKIVAVEVEDVWQLDETELTALKTKANDLIKPLEKSNLLSQGLVLKGSIESDINQLLNEQNQNLKPENRIRAYRQAKLALATTTSNLTQLENLVAQETSNSSLLGFAGGVGTTAVFGIILVVVAGFVFMSSYFKKLAFLPVSNHANVPEIALLQNDHTNSSSHSLELPKLSPLVIPPSDPRESWQLPAIITVVVVITASGTYLLTRGTQPPEPTQINQVIEATPSPTASPSPTPTASPTSSPSSSPSPTPTGSPVSGNTGTPFTHTLIVPEDSSVNIRNKPSSSGDIVMSIKVNTEIIVFEEEGDWTQIGFKDSDQTKGYWVSSQFVEEK